MAGHVQHPRIEERRRHGPHQTHHEHVGFNGRLAKLITKSFGSMWMFYALVGWMALWMALASAGLWFFRFDRYPFTFLLFLSNLVQLWALPVLAVGQRVLSQASDKQAAQTFRDAEAILDMADETLRLVRQIAATEPPESEAASDRAHAA